MSEPLIHTAKGNLPVAMLDYQTNWEDAPSYMKFVEVYRLDGEVVRESAHVYIKHGLPIAAETAQL